MYSVYASRAMVFFFFLVVFRLIFVLLCLLLPISDACRANDICRESKRQTINADDVLKALEEIEFPEFLKPLKASLDG